MSAMHNPAGHPHVSGHRHGRGPSSFWMHDPEAIFGELGLMSGDAFLDLGCGPGDYAIYAAEIVGDDGAVYAVDRWDEMVRALLREADAQDLGNIVGVISDITATLPLGDHCVDVCLLSTVLHTLDLSVAMEPLLGEVRRVLKPAGRLVIIECKKQPQSFGPPLQLRLSPEEVEAAVMPCGFTKVGFTDLGYNYMVRFEC